MITLILIFAVIVAAGVFWAVRSREGNGKNTQGPGDGPPQPMPPSKTRAVGKEN